MSIEYQVTFDCREPHALARFWAEAVGYEVEEQDEAFIRRMIAEGYASEDDTMEHEGKLVWKEGAACRDPETGRRLLFQTVPEPKSVKNRVHVDLFVGEERRAAEVDRLTALGATVLWDGREGPHTWVTMADPEGNEFCVT